MERAERVRWSGWGRWLSFALAGALILFSVPMILANAAVAGWNVFLAALLVGAVASGHKGAPTTAILISGLMAFRLALCLATGAGPLHPVAATLLLALGIGAAWHLRRQAKLFASGA